VDTSRKAEHVRRRCGSDEGCRAYQLISSAGANAGLSFSDMEHAHDNRRTTKNRMERVERWPLNHRRKSHNLSR
jgi:hypothetical protein